MILGAVFAILTGGGFVVAEYISQRGLRNNNAGNIRHSSIKWDGMSDTQTDASFVQFVTPEYGLRAMAKILITYNDKYGLNTVQGIINRWAPPVENNTLAYIANVSNILGVNPAQQIDVRAYMPQLISAIVKHENGLQPYDFATIANGVRLAGVPVIGNAFV